MRRPFRHKFLAGAVALLVAGGAGGAYAATHSGGDPQQGLLNDVAKRLHVSPGQLRSAIQGAFLDRLEAAVKSGEISQAEANRIKRRIEVGGVPFLFPLAPGGLWRRGFAPRFGMRAFAPAPLVAAARYLGVPVPQLFRDMQGGKSLADVARAQGKPVSGLEQVMIAAERARLARLLANGWITRAEARRQLDALRSQIANVVNRPPPHIAGPGPGLVPVPMPGSGPGVVPVPVPGSSQGPVPGQGPGPFGAPPGA